MIDTFISIGLLSVVLGLMTVISTIIIASREHLGIGVGMLFAWAGTLIIVSTTVIAILIKVVGL